jgi:hypothetical protein
MGAQDLFDDLGGAAEDQLDAAEPPALGLAEAGRNLAIWQMFAAARGRSISRDSEPREGTRSCR